MQNVIEHKSGLILSVKTFRPLLIFPWNSSIWRQLPMATCVATISYPNKTAAQAGHEELVKFLQDLPIDPDMKNLFSAIESYGQSKDSTSIKSVRVYPGHEVEGKISVVVRPEDKP